MSFKSKFTADPQLDSEGFINPNPPGWIEVDGVVLPPVHKWAEPSETDLLYVELACKCKHCRPDVLRLTGDIGRDQDGERVKMPRAPDWCDDQHAALFDDKPLHAALDDISDARHG